MVAAQPSGQTASLILIEACGSLIAIALAFFLPRFANASFERVERQFVQLARNKSLSVLIVGLTAIVGRLALLPICPKPLPFLPDDFSFLLAADTFVHGRLTNPTPAMWTQLESVHVTMLPTYMSMYFPTNGLLLAASELLFGHPWYGLLIMSGLMCAALCWMLQAWVPATWALLGGALAIMHLALFSYWINTYTGAGTICALGGALVLGSMPRLTKTMKKRYGFLMAVGIILLATTRPYEGLLLCLPVAVYLAHWAFFGNHRPQTTVLLRKAAAPLALIVAAGAWMGYYNYRVFGSPTTLPYTVDRATYAMAPYYIWQKVRPEPVYRQALMRRFYSETELTDFADFQTLSGNAKEMFIKVVRALVFYAGFALLPGLLLIRRVFLDKRVRFLIICSFVLAAGMSIQIFLIPHYLAPFTAVFYAIGLQGMRHLWVWKPGHQTVGRTLVRMTVLLCIAMTGLRIAAEPLHLLPPRFPASSWSGEWYGPGLFGVERAGVQDRLEHEDGKQLVLVRFTSKHEPLDEWVYNQADIDGSKVIWAWDMGDDNAALLEKYKDRQVWLAQPDNPSQLLTHYEAPQIWTPTIRLSELDFPR